MSNDLTLESLPMFRCCRHCKPQYCPDGKGHYVKCPNHCIEGQEEIPKNG